MHTGYQSYHPVYLSWVGSERWFTRVLQRLEADCRPSSLVYRITWGTATAVGTLSCDSSDVVGYLSPVLWVEMECVASSGDFFFDFPLLLRYSATAIQWLQMLNIPKELQIFSHCIFRLAEFWLLLLLPDTTTWGNPSFFGRDLILPSFKRLAAFVDILCKLGIGTYTGDGAVFCSYRELRKFSRPWWKWLHNGVVRQVLADLFHKEEFCFASCHWPPSPAEKLLKFIHKHKVTFPILTSVALFCCASTITCVLSTFSGGWIFYTRPNPSAPCMQFHHISLV